MASLPPRCFSDSSDEKKSPSLGRCGFNFFKIKSNDDKKLSLSYAPHSCTEKQLIVISKQTFSAHADAAAFIEKQGLPSGDIWTAHLLAQSGAMA